MILQTKIVILAVLIQASGIALASSEKEDIKRLGPYLTRCIAQPSPKLLLKENAELFIKTSPAIDAYETAFELDENPELKHFKLLLADRYRLPTDGEKRVLLWHYNDCNTSEASKFHSEALRLALLEYENLKEELDADIRSNSLTLKNIAGRSKDFNNWLEKNISLLLLFMNDESTKKFAEQAKKIMEGTRMGLEKALSGSY